MSTNDTTIPNSWIRSNLGVVLVIATMAIGIVSQWVQMQNSIALGIDTAARLRAHELDTDRHVDHVRDESRYQETLRRLDRMENKLDSLREVR